MTQITKNTEAHYETDEVPFGRSYKWHPAHIVVECDCGEKLTFTGTSTVTTCRCGADYGSLVHDIHRREERLRDEDVRPWLYDVRSQADQRLRDEAACTEGSSWRYNDVTSGLMDDDEERWKKA